MTFDRLVSVVGRGSLDLANSFAAGPTTPTGSSLSTIRSNDATGLTVANPISNADMWSWLGRQYGGTSNFANTSVVSTTGPGGSTSKVLDQYLQSGTFGMPGGTGNGTGIALTSCPLGASYEEATIEFDMRFVGSGQWPLGGKIPGLGGVLPGKGSVPTGGDPSIYGWSGRSMFRRYNPNPTVNGFWVGYIYDPTQPAGSVGQDRTTNQLFTWGTWVHVKTYYKMNTVTTEGSSSPPADGIHRMWWNGTLVYENLAQVYRYYAAARITHLVWDNFLGGNDPSWNAPSDVHVQFDNLLVQAA